MKQVLIAVLILLICLTIGFIWVNSLQVSEKSNAVSDVVAETFKPIVEPIIQPITSENHTILRYSYNAFIRKAAHVTEFMFLGVLLALFKQIKKKPQIFTILFITLTTAVADETIQIFNGRTDSVSDIVLDFAASVFGMLVATAVSVLVLWITKAVNRKEKTNHVKA